MIKTNKFLFLTCLILSACSTSIHNTNDVKLTTINIIDRNGFTETVNSQDRLEQYERVNFISNLPYDKVTRIFSRDAQGNVKAVITNYHPNGQPKQYLEVLNGRAYGTYKEWYENGVQHLEAFLVGGEGDLDLAYAGTWQFDGMSYAWNHQEVLIAMIPYSKGKKMGEAVYYDDQGKIVKRLPFYEDQIHGMAELYFSDGSSKQTLAFSHGILDGQSLTYWPNQRVAASEFYQNGLLQTGEYFNKNGNSVAKIANGEGKRYLYQDDQSYDIEEFHRGIVDGEVHHYTAQNHLEKRYFIKSGQKIGEETLYYTFGSNPKPKLQLTWGAGFLQGTAKTWYSNGQMESQREFSQNKKHGLSTAWYQDGNLMMIEEYDRDTLIKGEYFKKGDKQVVSRILNGDGTATLFDPEGHLLQKITYKTSQPILE